MLSALHEGLVGGPREHENGCKDHDGHEKRREDRLVAALLVDPHAESVDEKRQTQPERGLGQKLVLGVNELRKKGFPHDVLNLVTGYGLTS